MQGTISKLLYSTVKKAEPILDATSLPSLSSADHQGQLTDNSNVLKDEAMRSISRWALASLGIGAGIRGLMGLSQLTTKNLAAPTVSGNTAVRAMPVPHYEEEDEEEEKLKPKIKFAGVGLGASMIGSSNNTTLGKSLIGGGSDSTSTANWGLKLPPRGPEPPADTDSHEEWANYNKPDRGTYGFMAGDNATNTAGIPWYIPGLALGSAGALYGGYKLVDWLMKKRRKSETDSSLEDAKAKYHNALFAQYTPEQVQKWSNDNSEGSIDLLFDLISKRFEGKLEKVSFTMADTAGAAVGGLGLLAGTLALGSGIGTFKYVKNRSPEERIKKIINQRQRERWLRRPPEIFAVPSPISVTTPKFPEDAENDKDKDMQMKVSELVANLMS